MLHPADVADSRISTTFIVNPFPLVSESLLQILCPWLRHWRFPWPGHLPMFDHGSHLEHVSFPLVHHDDVALHSLCVVSPVLPVVSETIKVITLWKIDSYS